MSEDAEDAQWVGVVLNYLLDPLVNLHNGVCMSDRGGQGRPILPRPGSLPLETILNLIQREHPQLYTSVTRKRRRFLRALVRRHRDVFGLHRDADSGSYRVRWVHNRNCFRQDQQERAMRNVAHDEILQTGEGSSASAVPAPEEAAVSWLRRPFAGPDTVDDFVSAYRTWGGVRREATGDPLFPLPARGDLVRLLRRFPHVLEVHPVTYRLTLRY